MSNFADNIIDQSGQQVFLEDKHLNDQTSQTAIAATDAVMLKDTSGAYHSIDKGSFNEAVRAAMGSILTNFDKGTSITRIPGIDSSNDLGSVTAANLASVLGVNVYTGGSIDNLNTFKTNNHMIVAKNATGCPVADQFGYVMCITFGSYATQIYLPFSYSGLYVRSANIDAVDFTDSVWYSIALTAV